MLAIVFFEEKNKNEKQTAQSATAQWDKCSGIRREALWKMQ